MAKKKDFYGLTEDDYNEFRKYRASTENVQNLMSQAEKERHYLENDNLSIVERNRALYNHRITLNQLSEVSGAGVSVPGLNSGYMSQLQEQYTRALNRLDNDIKANRLDFGGLGMQTAAGFAPNGTQFDRGPLSQHLKPGRGLIDFNTGYPTESNQRAAQENAMRTQYQNIQTEAGQESARWGQQAAAAQTDKERADYWLNIISGLPVTNDARIKTSNDEWMRQAAQDLGIDSYIDRDDLLRKIRVKSTAAGASGTVATRRAEDYAGQQRAAMAYEYQLDNPNESLDANYYLAMRDQAARDIQNVDSVADYFDTKGAVGDWLRYNSAYGDQLYQDQKNEEILAIRSDPNVGPVYQEAMEASRNANEAERLLNQANTEIHDYSGIGAKTEMEIRELANRYGITVGQGDGAMIAALEQILQEQTHAVNTNTARLQAQGYDPKRIGQYIEQALNEQRADEESAAARQYADEKPGEASIGTSFYNLLSGGAYVASAPRAIGNAIAGITGNYDNYVPIDTNSEQFAMTRYVMDVRDEVTKNIQENGGTGFLYGVGMSMLDNVVQMAVGAALMGGAGAVAGQGARAAIQSGVQSAATASLATMGLSAASQELVRLTEQGVSSDQAFALATVKGAVEIVTEKIGIDNFVSNLGKKSTGNFVQQIVGMAAQQSAAEGGEEIIAEVAGLYADWLILQEESDIAKTIEAGRLNGMTESEALWDAFEKYALQVLEAGAAGAVSGLGFGAMSTAGMVADAVSPAATGARIRAEGNEPVLGMMASAYGLEYDESMTDRQIGKVYREVQKQADRVVKDMQYGISMESYAREKGYDTKTAKALSRSWNAYRTVDGNNMSSREFAATWNSVKAAGQANMSFDNAVAELGETTLSQYTLESAWKAGQRLYAQAQKTAKAQPVKPQETVQQENVPEVKLDTEIGEGVPAQTELVQRTSEKAATYAQQLMGERINVNGLSDDVVESFYDEIDSDIATERQGALAMARMLTGVSKNISQVIFVDSASYDAEGHVRLMSNGMWDPTNRTMTIDINAGRMNVEQQRTFMTRAMSHEITHSIKTTAREQYDELSRFVLREMDKQHNLEALIEAKIKDYASAGVELDREGAIDELVAEACEQMLERTDVLNKLARENRSLWEKIRDFFKAAIEKLRNLYKGMAPNSTEAKMMQGVIDELQAKWDAAFAASLTAEVTETSAAAQHSIAGRNAAIADIVSMENAVRMEEAGHTAPEIYNDTGWFRGADDMWRFEIDDSTMRYTPERMAQKMTDGAAHLEDVIDHPVLFEAYPQLRDVSVTFSPMKPGSQGVYRRTENRIYLADSIKNSPEATLIHEIQHAIQAMEGFAFGASRAYWKKIVDNGGKIDSKRLRDATAAVRKFEGSQGNKEIVDARNRLNSAWEEGAKAGAAMYAQLETEGIAEKVDAYEDMLWEQSNAGVAFLNSTPLELYQNTAGEQEARDVAERRTMTTEQRKGKMPQTGTKDTVFVEGSSESASEEVGVEIDTKTKSAAPIQYSRSSWNGSDYVTNVVKATEELATALNVSKAKAKEYIGDVNSIAKTIADSHGALDYESSPGRSSFVSNVEYGGSFDFSTLCAKRRLMTGTFSAIQEALPNTVLTAADVLEIRNRMKDAGLEVSCGLCYVEGSRANMGTFTKKFLELYEKHYGGFVPNMAQMNTPDGIEWVRLNHPEVYEKYEYFWNHYGTLKAEDPKLFASQQKPKLYQMRTEYKGEVLKNFTDPDTIKAKNKNGGIRLQSFSDFEIVHLIDCMQIITDMARVGLSGQAYAKVPEFAWALGDTGLKINLSLIAKGVDENGRVIFDDVEGMKADEALRLRDRYSKNVGTILVIFNDEQLKAAMADDRVDFIIPFHRSQWKKSQYHAMGLPEKTKDYTYMQNERYIKPQYHEYRGRMVRDKATNYMPNEYWDFNLSGKENAERYLRMCAENNKRPKFYRLLDNNGDGSYSLKKDGSTDGYWKLLIDFKMYDNEGNGSPQKPVRPDFNMEKANEMLENYKGGHRKFPVAQKIVDEFVADYKKAHPRAQYQVNAHTEMDRAYAEALNSGNMDAAQRLVEQAAATAGYWRSRWHETKPESDFHVFNINRADNASADNQTPYGIFTKAHDRTVGLGGKQMRLFVRADRILRFRDRDTMKQQMPEEYKALLRRLEEVDAKYGAEAEEMEDQFFWDIEEWLETQPNEDELRERIDPAKPFYESIGDAMPQELIDLETRMTLHSEEWHEAENVEILAAKEWLTKWLPANGYDAMELEYDNGAGDRVTDALIVLSEDQVKLADVITRDDDGNIIPLSERFKAGNKDIRYQISRDTASNMDLLMGASMDGLSKAEADHLLRYRDRVNEIRQNQRKIDELKAEELTADINAQIKRLENANSIIYRKVNAAEQTDLMQRIIERERAAGDIEVQRMDNRVADLEDEIDELEQKIRNAKLAGQMGQGRRDAATLRKAEERLTSRNEKQKAKAEEKAAQQKQRAADRFDAQKQKYSDKLKEQRTQAKQAAADARLAGQMEQGRRDAVALQRTVEEYEARLESKRRELRIARESRDKRIAQMQESRVKSMDSRHRTQMRHKIRKVVKELDALLLRGTKDRNIRDEMKAAVASALEAINMDSGDYEGRIAKLDEAIAAATDPVVIATLTESRERIAEQGSNMRARLSEMKTAYSNFSKDTSGNYNSTYDEVVQSYIDATIEKVGATPLWDMTVEQLDSVYNMYKMILTDIQQANKLVRDEKNRTIYSMGSSVIRELDGRKRHPMQTDVGRFLKKFGWDNLKPVYAFETIGSNTLMELYENVRGGEDTWARDVSEARAFYQERAEKYGLDKWDTKTRHTFYSRSGKEFSLDVNQIMSLYAYSKRGQADEHLQRGGFVFDSAIEVTEKKKGLPIKYKVNTKQAYGVDPLTLNDIIATLTDEQRNFVDEMQAYLSDTMGAKGNEVSLDMYGVRLFNEQNYFPLKTSKQFLFEQNEVAGEVKLKNSGFSKHTTPHASNPVILSNFMDVWGQHVNDMSMYHAFVIPLENFNRVYNYQTLTTDESEPDSVKGTLADIYGDAPVNYIKQLLTDLNGGARVDPTASVIDWGLSKFKSAAVMASASVVIQQPTAVVRAAAFVNPLYLGAANKQWHKNAWEELKRYAPVAIIKEMGRFDTNMGRSTTDWITDRKQTGLRRVGQVSDDVFSRPASFADEVGWLRIWAAVKKETAKKTDLKPGTQEFLEHCGKRFTYIIERSQVYDSVLSRSATMRSKDTGMKMATAFMAEPLTTMNMLVGSFKMRRNGYRGAVVKTYAAVAASLFLNSILVSLVYAARDDDEDESYAEKYSQALAERLIGNGLDITLVNTVPFLRDIISIFQGYDVSRTDMSMAVDFYKAYQTIISDTASAYDKVKTVTGELARLFGLPVKNLWRDAEGIYNVVKGYLENEGLWTPENAWGDIREGLYEGFTGKTISSGQKLYEAYMSGDGGKIFALEAEYQDAYGEDWYKQIQSDLRTHVKGLYLDGDLSYDDAMLFLMRYAIELTPSEERQHDAGTISDEEYTKLLEDAAYWTIKGWDSKAEDSDASTAKYADLQAVIEAGGDGTAAIEELLEHGETEKEIRSGASSIIADLYKNGEIDATTAEEYLAEYAGITDSKDLYTWFTEKDHWVETGENDYGAYGPVWDALVEGGDVNGAIDAMVKAGWTEDAIAQNIRTRTKEWVLGTASDGNTITPEEARNILSNYGGVDAEDLDAYVAAYNFWRDNPEYVDDFSIEQANDYLEYGTGIDIGMFLDFREAKSGMVGKKDANGETISGSVKAEAMAYIDALPITNAQKDQLYLMYWSESRIYEAPWH